MAAADLTGKDNDILKNCILFNRLNDAQLASLVGRLKPVAYRRNDVIFTRGTPGRELFIIKKGRVKISLSNAEGKDLILNILSTSDVFGEMALFSGLPRSADAIALSQVEAWSLDQQTLEDLFKTVPGLAMNLVSWLSRKLSFTTEQTELLGLLDAYGRVANRLLQLARPDENNRLVVNISQQDLAAMLGLTREWINKILKTFADQGAIELNRSRIYIHNSQVLLDNF